MYTKPNQTIIDKYVRLYTSAKDENSLLKCYLGSEKEFRLINQDSYFTEITDPEVMLEYVLYPLYLDGMNDIPDEMLNVMNNFIDSGNVLEIYQAFCYLNAEMMMQKIYDEVPFLVFNSRIAEEMKKKALEMKEELENYRIGEFGKYKSSMYDTIVSIMDASDLFV